jgi:4-amino-4-deoxy-L-arabinose transferase-like glycosyltransferase
MSIIYKVTIICLVLFSVFSVFIAIPYEDNFAKSADEGYNLKFAKLINQNGIAEFPRLAKVYIDNAEARLFPPPSRVAYIIATAAWFKLFPSTFTSLAKFSFLCFALFLAVVFFFSRKHFGADIACLLTLLLSSSPLMMAMGRRALSDMFGNLLWGLAVWLFLDFLEKKDRPRYFIFILACCLAVLAKESAGLLLIFFTAFFLVNKYIYGQKIANTYLLGIIALPIISAGITYVFLFKGTSNAFSLANAVFGTHTNTILNAQTNRYALLYCAGPWYKYIVDYLLLSPITTLLFIGYYFHVVFIRKFELKAAYFMSYFTIVFIICGNLRYAKIVRYVVNLDTVIALFAVLFLYELFRQRNAERQTRLVFLTAVAIFFINYGSFIDIFCVNGVYDPVSYCLLSVRKLIP